MGLQSVVSPLFEVSAHNWHVPDAARYDALLLTSANAPRHAGPQLANLLALPCYCVGDATAAEAGAKGLAGLRIGPGDGNALLSQMVEEGVERVLHLCGRHRMPLHHPRLHIDPITVYAAEPIGSLPPEAEAALGAGAVALLHSPRAARLFARLVDRAHIKRGAVRIAAISEAVRDAAGHGWGASAVASAPRDQALLELAAKLCNIDAVSGTGLGR